MSDIYVVPGQKVSITFKWTNQGDIPFAPRFAAATQRGGSWDSRIQGDWVEGGLKNPTNTSTEKTVSVVIPSEWDPGEKPDLCIYAEVPGFLDPTRVWTQNDFLQIPKIDADWIGIDEGDMTVSVE